MPSNVPCSIMGDSEAWCFYKPTMCETMLGVEKEIEYGVGGEALADNVAIGDNVVVTYESGNGK